VRGVVADRISAFYGIAYGASTTGAGRFMPPARPQPWTGVPLNVHVTGPAWPYELAIVNELGGKLGCTPDEIV